MKKRSKRQRQISLALWVVSACALILTLLFVNAQSSLAFSEHCKDCMSELNREIEKLRNTIVYVGSSPTGTKYEVAINLGDCADGLLMEELRNCEKICPNKQPVCWGIKAKSDCDFDCIKYTGCSGTSGQMEYVSDIDLKSENQTRDELRLLIQKSGNNILKIELL